jgi:hypothetical protein
MYRWELPAVSLRRRGLAAEKRAGAKFQEEHPAARRPAHGASVNHGRTATQFTVTL